MLEEDSALTDEAKKEWLANVKIALEVSWIGN